MKAEGISWSANRGSWQIISGHSAGSDHLSIGNRGGDLGALDEMIAAFRLLEFDTRAQVVYRRKPGSDLRIFMTYSSAPALSPERASTAASSDQHQCPQGRRRIVVAAPP